MKRDYTIDTPQNRQLVKVVRWASGFVSAYDQYGKPIKELTGPYSQVADLIELTKTEATKFYKGQHPQTTEEEVEHSEWKKP